MVRGQGKSAVQERPQETLSKTEIQGLENEKRELESVIKEAEDKDRAVGVDINQIRRKIQNIDNAIEERMPDTARGVKKDSLIREEREIEDKLVDGMPTRYEMDHPARCPGAVRKHLKWLSVNKSRIERYVQIQRIIRPDDPKSVEALRKDK